MSQSPQILFVLQKPGLNPEPWEREAAEKQWKDALLQFSRIEYKGSSTQQLGENVWLIALHNGLPFLSALGEAATGVGFPYQAFLIDGEMKQIA